MYPEAIQITQFLDLLDIGHCVQLTFNMVDLPIEESIMTLDSIHKHHTIHTNLRSTYGTKWEPWEAFRELVQNWYVMIHLHCS